MRSRTRRAVERTVVVASLLATTACTTMQALPVRPADGAAAPAFDTLVDVGDDVDLGVGTAPPRRATVREVTAHRLVVDVEATGERLAVERADVTSLALKRRSVWKIVGLGVGAYALSILLLALAFAGAH